mgnify:CR=1 FL=1
MPHPTSRVGHIPTEARDDVHVQVEHPIRPGVVEADNPHHFVIFEVDADRLWLQVVTTVAAPFLPQPTKIELSDTGG